MVNGWNLSLLVLLRVVLRDGVKSHTQGPRPPVLPVFAGIHAHQDDVAHGDVATVKVDSQLLHAYLTAAIAAGCRWNSYLNSYK